MVEDHISLRPFTPGDQTAARALILNGLGEHYGFIDETLNPDLDDIAASYLANGHLFFVAECSSILVGTGALLLSPGASGQIVRISTHPTHRRKGIARAICQQLIEAARLHDLVSLTVETNDDWHDALRLYRQLGFVEYRQIPGSICLQLTPV
jgi:ribosomal protein S18 acetylase RimI-like enzyme